MQHLDPNAVWGFFLKSVSGMLVIVPGFLIFLIIPLVADSSTSSDFNPFYAVFLAVIVLFLLTAFPLLQAWLTYKFYLYELREDGFRKENGIIWKRYVTIPYERIQNVDIYRGVIDRLLGLSVLHIQTAGGTVRGGSGTSPEGQLPGLSVKVAEQVRDELVRRAKHSNSGGL
jgi:uncharacterized protein